MNVSKKTQWHPAFCSALQLEFRDNQDDLDYLQEYNLSNKPLQMDLLIIKKHTQVSIRNEIGHLFRKYNIVEYKGPGDELNIDKLYKTIGYACLYKGLGKEKDIIPSNELTITLARWSSPTNLFMQLRESGYKVINNHNGIYYVMGLIDIPLQIIVLSMLSAQEHLSLKMLTKNVKEQDAKAFLQKYRNVKKQGDKDNVDAVLQVGVIENSLLFYKLRGETDMHEALKELMKDDIEEMLAARLKDAIKNAVAEKDETIANLSAEIEQLKKQLAAKS